MVHSIRTLGAPLFVLCIGLIATGCGGGYSGSNNPSGGGTSAPTITTQPANQTVSIGQQGMFSVMASGTGPLSYQWEKNGTAISGATSASYTTPAVAAGDNGEQFRVVVNNSYGSVMSNAATLTVNAANAPAITTQPTNQTISAGQQAMFSVTASGTAPLSYQWQKNGADVSGATSPSYTTPVTTSADNGEQFRVVVSNTFGSVTSSMVTLTVNTGAATLRDVITYHYDNMRTGQNLNETTLTTSNVSSAKFGKLGEFLVDGKVDAQPLLLTNVAISGGNKNVLYVATEHGSVYAFDTAAISGQTSAFLWKVSTLGSGETTSDPVGGCGQVTPEIGITSTPVIDRSRNAIYVIAMSKDSQNNYFQRIHALNLSTGAELFGGPVTVQASFPGNGPNSSGGNVVFDPKQYKHRPALLQVGSTIYTMWSSHCDINPYTGWVITYDAGTLQKTAVLNLTPNGSEGAIWMSDTGPAADSAGNVYAIVGNGTFDTTLSNGFPSSGDCGNCFVKLSNTNGLKLADYFTPSNTVSESNADTDFGSGGPLLLPDVVDANNQTRHLAIGSGKDSNIYVVDRDNMGKFNANGDQIYQQINGQLGGAVFAKPSYFNGAVYYGAVGDALKAFPITSGKLAGTPASQSAHHFGYPGASPTISANGNTSGIVWAVDNAGILFAFDATNLNTELYDSNQAANSRDNFSGNKFITAVVANGRVYVGTPSSVAVFGLLP
jgi:hypothetical protein